MANLPAKWPNVPEESDMKPIFLTEPKGEIYLCYWRESLKRAPKWEQQLVKTAHFEPKRVIDFSSSESLVLRELYSGGYSAHSKMAHLVNAVCRVLAQSLPSASHILVPENDHKAEYRNFEILPSVPSIDEQDIFYTVALSEVDEMARCMRWSMSGDCVLSLVVRSQKGLVAQIHDAQEVFEKLGIVLAAIATVHDAESFLLYL